MTTVSNESELDTVNTEVLDVCPALEINLVNVQSNELLLSQKTVNAIMDFENRTIILVPTELKYC